MVISRRASAKAVVEIDKANTQVVSFSATASPLSAPNLRNVNYCRVRPAKWRVGGCLIVDEIEPNSLIRG